MKYNPSRTGGGILVDCQAGREEWLEANHYEVGPAGELTVSIQRKVSYPAGYGPIYQDSTYSVFDQEVTYAPGHWFRVVVGK